MVIDRIVVGPIQCNCYIVADESSGKAYLIDPGAESSELISYVQKTQWELQAILITHCHIDHIGGINTVTAQRSVPVLLHPADEFLYNDVTMQARLFGVTPSYLHASQPSPRPGALGEELSFEFGSSKLSVLHTPGHTPGSVCFHAEDAVFTGDTLFQASIGRTDLWGGSFQQIINSIKTKLLTMSDTVRVFPGHGEQTTIGEERRNNPFLATTL
jgi:hydroxyacylglutathione hydrolase